MIFAGTKNGKDYGFYLERDGLKDVVELTDEEHMALMDAQAEGKVIVFHKSEKPTLQDPPPPSDDELARAARQKRDALIAAIQWRIERYSQQKTLGVKTGDFAAWAVDSSADVSKAFEFKNFGVFGALLIQVISGDHFRGISQVGNLSVVTSYIDSVAPPVMYTVRTPELKPIGICKKRVLVRTHFPEQTYAALYNKRSLAMSARPQIMKYPQACAPKPSTAEHWLHPNDTPCNTGAILGSNMQNHAPSVPVRNGSCVRTTPLAPDCRGRRSRSGVSGANAGMERKRNPEKPVCCMPLRPKSVIYFYFELKYYIKNLKR